LEVGVENSPQDESLARSEVAVIVDLAMRVNDDRILSTGDHVGQASLSKPVGLPDPEGRGSRDRSEDFIPSPLDHPAGKVL
jgi:hypothetical protein